MKAPEPLIPHGAPPGTAWFGGPIEWSSITLRIRGDAVDPEEITRLLGCRPDLAHRRGDPILGADGTLTRVARTGAWHLKFARDDTDEWDCGEAMVLFLQRLSADVGAWRRLSERFAVDLYVCLAMHSSNKGFCLTSEAMRYLGERGIKAGFDVLYAKEPEVEP